MTDPSTAATHERVAELIERALYRGPTITADRLVGVDSCIKQLMTQILTLTDPAVAARMKAEPSGTLFIGPPGTGKTLVARYLAGSVGLPMYQFSAEEFGENPEVLSGVFRALGGQKALMYIDEVSILSQKREWSGDRGRRMLSALLTSLDGLRSAESDSQLWVIGACTPDIALDPAIHRSGRLGVMIEFAPPSAEQRRRLFDLYLAGIPHELDDEGLDRLSDAAVGATGADIKDWVRQASSEALSEDPTMTATIKYKHLELVVARRGFIRAERPGREPTFAICLHEAAHAVIGYHLFGADSVGSVSVGFQPGRGFSRFRRGHFQFSDDWLAENEPNSATWRDHAAVALAGAAAEEVVLGYRGDGATADVSAATSMVIERLDVADPVFGPGRDAIETNTRAEGAVVGSELMRAEVWALTRARFDECWQRALALAGEHRADIERLAAALFATKASFTGEEIVALLETEFEVAA